MCLTIDCSQEIFQWVNIGESATLFQKKYRGCVLFSNSMILSIKNVAFQRKFIRLLNWEITRLVNLLETFMYLFKTRVSKPLMGNHN